MTKTTIQILEDGIQLVTNELNELKTKTTQIPFTLFAKGKGVVNYNGNSFGTKARTNYNNNLFPKMMNAPDTYIAPETNEVKSVFIDLDNSPNFGNATFFASAACFKQKMYEKESFGLCNIEDPLILLCSSQGLLNGFVVASTVVAQRTSPIFLSELITDFLSNEDEQNIDLLKKHGLSEDHLTKNGKMRVDFNTNQKSTNSLFRKVNSLLQENFYKSTGLIQFDKLQFITIGGELGRDSVGGLTKETAENLVKTLNVYLNNIKNEVLNSVKINSEKSFRKTIDYIKNNQIELTLGKFRQVGGIAQIADENLEESGILLNNAAVAVLILKYFDLMLNTKIVRTNADLEALEVVFENIDDLNPVNFANHYIFTRPIKDKLKETKKE